MLLVDDEVQVARALERWLKRRGADVVVLTDTVDLEAVLLRERPTLIISDFLMPGLDGVAVLLAAKRLAPSVARCLLSGSLFLVTAAQRASLEPCLFVDKPWDDGLAAQLGLAEQPP